MSAPCVASFVFSFIFDIGGDPFCIGPKLESSVNTYNNNKSSITLGDIGNDLFNCLQPHLTVIENTISEEIRVVVIFIVITTAILMILIVILFSILDKSKHYDVIILLAILFALLYILACYFFVRNAQNNIAIIIDNNDVIISSCIDKAVTDLKIVEQTNNNALQLALCSYHSGCS
jgi:amino acid transporter